MRAKYGTQATLNFFHESMGALKTLAYEHKVLLK